MDTHDIREDLKLEGPAIQKYFLELGCAVAPPTETEMVKLKIIKTEKVGHRIAKLRLPLVFPKMRVPMSGKKKK